MITAIAAVLIVILIDQKAKAYARENFTTRQEQGFLTFYLVKNPGAFRGFLKNKPKLLLGLQTFGTVFVTLLTILSALRGKDKVLTVGLALISGGSIGNMIDRITEGEVTDFVAIKWTKNLYYNLADFAIFLGALIALVRSDKM